MTQTNIALFLFFCFALGLPLWAMQDNQYDQDSAHACTGDCYSRWQQETGGVVTIAVTQAATLTDEDMKNIAVFVETLQSQ